MLLTETELGAARVSSEAFIVTDFWMDHNSRYQQCQWHAKELARSKNGHW